MHLPHRVAHLRPRQRLRSQASFFFSRIYLSLSRVPRNTSLIGRGTVTCDQKLFLCGFLWHTLLKKCRPDLGTLKTMYHRLRKRWDENTLLNK